MNRSLLYTDEVLIAGIRKDEDQALAHLYKLHFPMILQLVLLNNGTEEEAKDVYQEGVIIFYEKIRQEEFELTCQIKTYLYSVCRRLWLKRLAEKNRYSGKLEEAEEAVPFEKQEVQQQEDNELRFSVMADALAQLGEPCRSLIEDFYVLNLSMQEIADKFGYTNPENAKNQKYKCLQRLKKLFFAQYREA